MASRKNRSIKYLIVALGIINMFMLVRLITLYAPISGALGDAVSVKAQMGRRAHAIAAPTAPSVATAPSAADPSDATAHSIAADQTVPALYDTDFSAMIDVADIEDTRFLELVNHGHPVAREADAAAIVPAWPGLPVSHTDISLHERAREAAIELFAEARSESVAAGTGSFYVSSGYRDYDKQEQLYNEIGDKTYAQPPGHSEHQTGLAIDIMALGVHQSEMAASREGRWLAQNAWKHGFILRYADDKQGITGIAGEPWHFRYIGRPHARHCYENNLSLEEYILFLKESGGYEAEHGGIYYYVLYQQPLNSTLYVPDNMEYSISGDNAGGFIITAWQ